MSSNIAARAKSFVTPLLFLLVVMFVFDACMPYEHFTKRRYKKGYYSGHAQKLNRKHTETQEPTLDRIEKLSSIEQGIAILSKMPHQVQSLNGVDNSISSSSQDKKGGKFKKLFTFKTEIKKSPNKKAQPYERPPDDGLYDISKKPRTLALIMGACFITTGLGVILCIPLLIMSRKRLKMYRENPQMYKNGEELSLYVTVGWIGVGLLIALAVFGVAFFLFFYYLGI